MCEEVEILIKSLIRQLKPTNQYGLLVSALERALQELYNGSPDGPDEGDGPDW